MRDWLKFIAMIRPGHRSIAAWITMHAGHRHRAAFGIAAVLILGLPLLLACHAAAGEHGTQSGGTADAALIQEVMKRVERSYVEPVQSDKLASDALKGMLAGLDPHSSYMDEQEYQQLRSEMRGKFGGIGVQIALLDGVPAVSASSKSTASRPSR
jgi:carboxyl-terminal processing protease